MMDANDETLIPGLKDWRQHNPGFSMEDWIACEGNISLAIGFSLIFWPDFIVHDDCVFFASHFSEDNFRNWTKAPYIQHYAQIESVMNHVHILDLFSDDKPDNINEAQVKFFGNVLCNIYRVKLKAEFPDRDFTVSFNGDRQQEDLMDYELTFCQPKNEQRKP